MYTILELEDRGMASEPADKVTVTFQHDSLLVHDVFLLARVDDVNLLEFLHRERPRRG